MVELAWTLHIIGIKQSWLNVSDAVVSEFSEQNCYRTGDFTRQKNVNGQFLATSFV